MQLVGIGWWALTAVASLAISSSAPVGHDTAPAATGSDPVCPTCSVPGDPAAGGASSPLAAGVGGAGSVVGDASGVPHPASVPSPTVSSGGVSSGGVSSGGVSSGGVSSGTVSSGTASSGGETGPGRSSGAVTGPGLSGVTGRAPAVRTPDAVTPRAPTPNSPAPTPRAPVRPAPSAPPEVDGPTVEAGPDPVEPSPSARELGWTTVLAADEFTTAPGPAWSLFDGVSGATTRSPDRIRVTDGLLVVEGTAAGRSGGLTWTGQAAATGRWETRLRFVPGTGYVARLSLWSGRVQDAPLVTVTLPASGPPQVTPPPTTTPAPFEPTGWQEWGFERTAGAVVVHVDGRTWTTVPTGPDDAATPVAPTVQLDRADDAPASTTRLELDRVASYRVGSDRAVASPATG